MILSSNGFRVGDKVEYEVLEERRESYIVEISDHHADASICILKDDTRILDTRLTRIG